jgi:hypothetical protein
MKRKMLTRSSSNLKSSAPVVFRPPFYHVCLLTGIRKFRVLRPKVNAVKVFRYPGTFNYGTLHNVQGGVVNVACGVRDSPSWLENTVRVEGRPSTVLSQRLT